MASTLCRGGVNKYITFWNLVHTLFIYIGKRVSKILTICFRRVQLLSLLLIQQLWVKALWPLPPLPVWRHSHLTQGPPAAGTFQPKTTTGVLWEHGSSKKEVNVVLIIQVLNMHTCTLSPTWVRRGRRKALFVSETQHQTRNFTRSWRNFGSGRPTYVGGITTKIFGRQLVGGFRQALANNFWPKQPFLADNQQF